MEKLERFKKIWFLISYCTANDISTTAVSICYQLVEIRFKTIKEYLDQSIKKLFGSEIISRIKIIRV